MTTILPTILITGGTGFIGKSILDHLDQFMPSNIHILSRGQKKISQTLWPNLNIKLHEADISLPISLSVKPHFIIHAATSTLPHESNSLLHSREVIIEGTKNAITFAKQSQCQHFMFISSGAVYGMNHQKPIVMEEQGLLPETVEGQHYRNGKIIAEKLCLDFYQETSIATTIARCFAFSGPHILPYRHYAICNILEQAKIKKNVIIKGNGQAVRSYLDQRDLGKWLITLMLENKNFDVVNVGSDIPITILELAKIIAHYFEAKIEILNQEGIINNYYVPDLAKAKNKYQLKSDVTLLESISSMIKVM